MDKSILERFNSEIDTKQLSREISSASGERVDVPAGQYEVKIVKLEIGESRNHQPMAKVWFKIVAGEYAGQMIFMNQVLTSAFAVKKFNDFLSSLHSDIPVVFEDYIQYGALMDAIYNAIDMVHEYALEYVDKNDKGFSEYTITDVYDVEGDLPF